jgi:hypothetical protein
MRPRYGFTPRRACELDGSQHTSGAKAFAHAPPVGGDLGVGSDEGRRRLRFSAGAAARQWQRSVQRVARWSPSFRRGRAKEARARTVAPLRYIDVAGCTATRLARSGTGTDAWRRPDRSNEQRCSIFCRPAVHDWHERLAGPFETCAGPNMATCGTTSPQTMITFDRRIDGHCCSVVDALRRRL